MKTVTVIARETFPYDGITRVAGDAFEASREDARILALVGRVELRPSARPESRVSAEQAEPSGEADLGASGDEGPPARRRSRRKDIVPEP